MDVFSLVAKLSLDSSEYDSGLDNAKSTASSVAGAIGNGLAGVAKVGAAAVGAAAAGITALGTMAVKGYADYEQLTGGVETLFKNSSDTVMGYAENAYKTAGLSANEYMETVTSFSASLLQSLGGDTDAAAQVADMAITDMADNANKMGTSMESIQNAYQGFAKANYTMLDNLKLGYGGTKEEMQRLLEDAGKISGIEYDISSYADIVDAIHVVQNEMGITGTTAKEASETISGSFASLKSAWANLVTGLANGDADLGGLIDNVVTSAETAFKNVLPVAEKALSGIGELVTNLAPVIAEKLPALVSSVLPDIINAAISLVNSLVQALPTIIQALMDVAPQILMQLADGIQQALPLLLSTAVMIINNLVNYLTENAEQIVEGAIALLNGLATALIDNIATIIPAIIQLMLAIGLALVENLPTLVKSVIDIIISIGKTIIDNAPMFLDACWQILVAIGELVAEYGGQLLTFLGDQLSQLAERAGEGLSNLLNTFVEWLSQLPTQMAYWAGFAIGQFLAFFINLPANIAQWFTTTMETVKAFGENLKLSAISSGKSFFDGLVDNIKTLPSKLRQLGSELVNALKDLPKKFLDIGTNIVKGLWDGIKGAWSWLTEKVSGLFGSLVKGIKDGLGIASPSKVFAEIGKFVDLGYAKGIEDNFGVVQNAMGAFDDINISPQIQSVPSNYDSKSDIIKLLEQIATNQNVTVVLEGDAQRLFRVVQRESSRNKQITGQESFA